MVYTWKQIVEREGNLNKAYLSIVNDKYKKVSYGIYVDDGELISELEQLFVRYPRATLTMQGAFEYYGLSDYVPNKYHIVTPTNSHTINSEKVSQTYMKEEMIDIGREKIDTRYGYIYIFDKERMLIELFRLKTKLPLDYFLEVVSSYRKLKTQGTLSLHKVSDYCLRITNGNRILKEIIEMI